VGKDIKEAKNHSNHIEPKLNEPKVVKEANKDTEIKREANKYRETREVSGATSLIKEPNNNTETYTDTISYKETKQLENPTDKPKDKVAENPKAEGDGATRTRGPVFVATYKAPVFNKRSCLCRHLKLLSLSPCRHSSCLYHVTCVVRWCL
jgi:cell division protein FtsN